MWVYYEEEGEFGIDSVFHSSLFREQEQEVLYFAIQVMTTDETDADSSS
mgnify:FL=1